MIKVIKVKSLIFFLVPHSGKRLGLFYLANDVVQNGRKKAKDLVLAFGKAFYEVMPLYS